MNVLSLFAGIGGLELGLERAGMTTVAQVELDPFCRSILARHWPNVVRHDDVRTFPEWWASEPRPQVDLVCGGFPCQPFSDAGLKKGVADERWGWPWFFDVIRAVRPSYVVVENVAALVRYSDAFGQILSDLASFGFDAEWSVLSACSMGAPHVRKRLFLVAYPDSFHAELEHSYPENELSDAAREERARVWRERVFRAVTAARGDSRESDGFAHQMVHAGGNAVVPAVAEHVGHMIANHARQHVRQVNT